MDYNKLADLIFGDVNETVEDVLQKYPKRQLQAQAMVTRFAPSPTGYMHIGGLYAALISSRLARQSGGVFYLRIEDTDKKRELEGGIEEIVNALSNYDIKFDEGPFEGNTGKYGPYKQSERKDIYRVFVKNLMQKGLAYPCFATVEELDAIRKVQEEKKLDIGYYGEFALSRNLTYEQVEANIKAGKEFVVRLKSPGNPKNRIVCRDAIRGNIEMPENILDVVLLKSDGIPTYHFAHVVDDYLMGTTHVIRGDEWVSSYPIHEQLFKVCELPLPIYAHIAPIMKLDETAQGNVSKRKLSKRKDPEAAVNYYSEKGYPVEAVIEYLLTIANSNYEEWRLKNPDANNEEFKLKLNKMSTSGALFDMEKFTNISKEVVSKMSIDEIDKKIIVWAGKYDEKLSVFIKKDEKMFRDTIALWKFIGKKVRKDIAKWSDLSKQYGYLYDSKYNDIPFENYELDEIYDVSDIREILEKYKSIYKEESDGNEWFNTAKELAEQLGYCGNMKEYKKNPENYKGSITDVCTIIRVAVTGKKNTPDLYSIMMVLGKENVLKRIDFCLQSI